MFEYPLSIQEAQIGLSMHINELHNSIWVNFV